MYPLLERGLFPDMSPTYTVEPEKAGVPGIEKLGLKFVRGWGRKWELSGDLRYVEPRGSVRAGRADQI